MEVLYPLLSCIFLNSCVTGRSTHCTALTYLCWGFVVLGCNLFDFGVIQKGGIPWLSPTQKKEINGKKPP